MNPFIPTARIAILALLLNLCAGLATAQTNSANYTFLIGSGFLCDGSDASTCLASAKAVQGDSFELSGAGMFDEQSKSVKAAGTFSHNSANGNVVETGVWIASEFVSFVSYGVAPNALRERSTLNPAQWVHMRSKVLSGPMPIGGLAVFRIQLLSLSGTAKTGLLEMNCALGHVPPERSVEGIRLNLEDDSNEFSEEGSGRVMFLSMRPESSSTAKALARR
jgi:hypothetical protein